jgi:SP family general alpha glucoside:H+ symporter-like MFS transporter
MFADHNGSLVFQFDSEMLFAVNAFIFITFFSPSVPVLIVAELLCAIPWGVFATTRPAYASEVSPLALRG